MNYEEITDLKIKNPFDQEFIDGQKKKTAEMVNAKDAKLVCITFTFLTDNEILSDYKLKSKNFDENEFDEDGD